MSESGGVGVAKWLFLNLTAFACFVCIFSTYKLYALVITFLLSSVLVFYSTSYFVQMTLSRAPNQHETASCDTLTLQRQLALFLFRNEFVYRLIRATLVRKRTLAEHILVDSLWTQAAAVETRVEPTRVVVVAADEAVDQLQDETRTFLNGFSTRYLESWYVPYVSDNRQFLAGVQQELALIMSDVFARLGALDKLDLFARATRIVNEHVSAAESNRRRRLHPALEHMPHSQIGHLTRLAKSLLRSSAAGLQLQHVPIREHILSQIIGKMCLMSLVDLLATPGFVYYAICMLISREKTNRRWLEWQQLQQQQQQQQQQVPPTAATIRVETVSNVGGAESINTTQEAATATTTTTSRQEQQEEEEEDEAEEEAERLLSGPPSLVIFNLRIGRTETSYEPKTAKEFTLYTIEVACLLA